MGQTGPLPSAPNSNCSDSGQLSWLQPLAFLFGVYILEKKTVEIKTLLALWNTRQTALRTKLSGSHGIGRADVQQADFPNLCKCLHALQANSSTPSQTTNNGLCLPTGACDGLN